jgi:hypothetical protein
MTGADRFRSAALSEPVTVAEWWRNRSGQSIRVRLSPWEGRTLIDVSTWVTVDGKLVPAKGFAADVRNLPRLVLALSKAESRARELGLIADETQSEAAND